MRHTYAMILALVPLGLVLLDGCPGKKQTDEQILQSATRHHREDDLDDAISDFQLMIQQYPKSDKVPEALYAMGVIYQNRKKEYRRAESLYTKIVMEFPEDPIARGAAYQRARILADNLHLPDSAITAYELFLHRYPDAMAAASARLELDSLTKSVKQAK